MGGCLCPAAVAPAVSISLGELGDRGSACACLFFSFLARRITSAGAARMGAPGASPCSGRAACVQAIFVLALGFAASVAQGSEANPNSVVLADFKRTNLNPAPFGLGVGNDLWRIDVSVNNNDPILGREGE